MSLTGDYSSHCDEVLNKSHPQQSDTFNRVLDVVRDVAPEMTCQNPVFSCELLGSGSYHDGTIITALDEVDLVLKLLIGEYELMPHDDSTKFDICPPARSQLQGFCTEDSFIDGVYFRERFEQVLGDVLQTLCREKHVSFGRYNKPYFSGFRHNGPALAITMEDISVDFVVVFQAPHQLMYELLHKRSQPDVLQYIKITVPRYWGIWTSGLVRKHLLCIHKFIRAILR